MKLIKPSVEIWEQKDIWTHVARCTRVCYQSEPKKNGETDEEFVKRVILRSSTGEQYSEKLHGAMLEHGTVYITWLYDLHYNDTEKYVKNKYSKVVYRRKNNNDTVAYITTNLRVIYENGWERDLDYVAACTQHAKRVTVCFTTNIGVSREFNRHRVNSIAEESTRYCNYSKKNNGELNVVPPAWGYDEVGGPIEWLNNLSDQSLFWFIDDMLSNNMKVDEIWDEWSYYFAAIKMCEWAYNKLISKGWTPQKAREVLPLATKTQLVHTAFIDDWEHFCNLRGLGVSGTPHPNAKCLATLLYYKLFDKTYFNR